jgi:hypothetical protein
LVIFSSFAVPRVAFNSSDYTVMEGESITLGIQLLDDITQPLTLTIHTEDFSAVSAIDYRPLDQNITFHHGGDTSLTVMVEALPDDLVELVEFFRVVMSQPSLGLEESATVHITDSNGNRRLVIAGGTGGRGVSLGHFVATATILDDDGNS